MILLQDLEWRDNKNHVLRMSKEWQHKGVTVRTKDEGFRQNKREGKERVDPTEKQAKSRV